jgi:hypothetical protein
MANGSSSCDLNSLQGEHPGLTQGEIGLTNGQRTPKENYQRFLLRFIPTTLFTRSLATAKINRDSWKEMDNFLTKDST